MELEKQFRQHGYVTTFDHSFAVAIMCVKLADELQISVDRASLVRGALLHDYYLYDWHEDDKSHRLHGFRHAKKALQNADRDFCLNETEKNMIKTHMFPLNLSVPRHSESIILCTADKICATREIAENIRIKLKLISDVSGVML